MSRFLLFLILLPTLSFSQEDPPYVKTDSIFATIPYIDVENGVTILVQCNVLADSSLSLKKLSNGQILDSSRTLTISYIGTTLSVKNPFDMTLGYDAYLYSPSMDKYYLRKTYPVRPKIGAKEIYLGESKFFRLSNFHLADYEKIRQEKLHQQDLMTQYNKSLKKKKKKKKK